MRVRTHRVSPPRSEASAKHSQEAEAAHEEREQAPSARSAGSDKSAPSVAQRTSGQGRRHRKRSYGGNRPAASLCSAPRRVSQLLCGSADTRLWGGWTTGTTLCRDMLPPLPLHAGRVLSSETCSRKAG